MGQRTAVLDSGELQPVAPPLELYHRPANRFVASFVGSPPMNFFEGRIVAGDGILMFRGPSFEDTRPMTAATNGGARSGPGRRDTRQGEGSAIQERASTPMFASVSPCTTDGTARTNRMIPETGETASKIVRPR